ncbi:hypothetical protein DCCM_3501 [Desulfocucumis palustris]|uniref:Uncharacterized protein n=1 Tax=Desulfocucumis palustris TaxID=1898651 RepID=A0A2L2XDS5_9FIRM|nr:hypothetical protein DCCM_3501 [Desulfocucumis palustris]
MKLLYFIYMKILISANIFKTWQYKFQLFKKLALDFTGFSPQKPL